MGALLRSVTTWGKVFGVSWVILMRWEDRMKEGVNEEASNSQVLDMNL